MCSLDPLNVTYAVLWVTAVIVYVVESFKGNGD